MGSSTRSSLRVISWILTACLTLEPLAYAAPVPARGVSLNDEKTRIELPVSASVATLDEAYFSKKSGAKTVYLVQDAHTNASAQFNLAELLDGLFAADADLRTVFVEAGFGNDTLSTFRPFTPLADRKRNASAFVRQGFLGGEEYLNLTSDVDFTIWGVEDKALYDKAVESYRTTRDSRERFGRFLDSAETTLSTLAPRVLNPVLASFSAKRRNYSAGKLSLTDYFQTLETESARLNLSSKKGRALSKLSAIRALEQKIDFTKAQAEQQKAVASLSAADREELAGHSPEKLRMKEEGENAFYARLEEKLSAEAGKTYPELFRYLDYRRQARALDLKAVLDDVSAFEARVLAALTLNDEERAFLDAQTAVGAWRKLFAFTMTPDEFASYRALAVRMPVRQTLGFLNRKVQELGSHAERALFLEPGFEDVVRTAESFYELTLARDEVFLKNLTEQMDEAGLSKSVLIAGGYHSANLKNMLKARGFSYVSIVPQVLHETNLQRYESVLLGDAFASRPTVTRSFAPRLTDTLHVPDNVGFFATFAGIFEPMGNPGARLAEIKGMRLGGKETGKRKQPRMNTVLRRDITLPTPQDRAAAAQTRKGARLSQSGAMAMAQLWDAMTAGRTPSTFFVHQPTRFLKEGAVFRISRTDIEDKPAMEFHVYGDDGGMTVEAYEPGGKDRRIGYASGKLDQSLPVMIQALSGHPLFAAEPVKRNDPDAGEKRVYLPGSVPHDFYQDQGKTTKKENQEIKARYQRALDSGYEIDPNRIDYKRLNATGGVLRLKFSDMLKLLKYSYDLSDPDALHIPQIVHNIQVALRAKNDGAMMELMGYLHDLTKIIALDLFKQRHVGGDIYPLGVEPKSAIGRNGREAHPFFDKKFWEASPDFIDGAYPKGPENPYGDYAAEVKAGTMSLEKMTFVFQHDALLAMILDDIFDGKAEAKHNVPAFWQPIMRFIAKFHSFYPGHQPEIGKSPYAWAFSKLDNLLMRFVQMFQPHDLYSKTEVNVDQFLAENLDDAIAMLDEYFPDAIRMPVLTDGIPKLLQLENAGSVDDVLEVLFDDARFDESGVTLVRSERFLNGWLAALHEKHLIAQKAGNKPFADSLLRITQEIAAALKRQEHYVHPMRVTTDELLKDFDAAISSRPEALQTAIAAARLATTANALERSLSRALQGYRTNAMTLDGMRADEIKPRPIFIELSEAGDRVTRIAGRSADTQRSRPRQAWVYSEYTPATGLITILPAENQPYADLQSPSVKNLAQTISAQTSPISAARLALRSINPTTTTGWQNLAIEQKRMAQLHLRDLFGGDPQRAAQMTQVFQSGDARLTVDFSKNLIDPSAKRKLEGFARQMFLDEAIKRQFAGDIINQTENRAVLHTALRAPADATVLVDGQNVVPMVHRVLAQMRKFTEAITSGSWKGYAGDEITDIVNIGIGGSDLGPVMATEALKPYATGKVRVHFVSNVDGSDFHEKVVKAGLDPKKTLFIIASKTFTTQETMTNAQSAREWFLKATGDNVGAIKKHFVAVSTAKDKVEEFGIDPANMFEFWDWVGGRYSMWSAIGLSIATYIGMDNFLEMLAGAHDMDEHFRTTPFEQNIPVQKALLGIWYRNFFGAETHAVLPYDQYLHRLPAYLQQAVMESNGKGVDRAGHPISYKASSIIFGEAGTNGQHSFYQLFHQGTNIVPADFIGVVNPAVRVGDHHEKLLSNFLAQTKALAFGKTREEAIKDGVKPENVPHRVFTGNNPSTSILLNSTSPRALGALVAMYEQQIFTEGVLMNVFSYDQWGVELGKVMAGPILKELKGEPGVKQDGSTAGLLEAIRAQREGARLALSAQAASASDVLDRHIREKNWRLADEYADTRDAFIWRELLENGSKEVSGYLIEFLAVNSQRTKREDSGDLAGFTAAAQKHSDRNVRLKAAAITAAPLSPMEDLDLLGAELVEPPAFAGKANALSKAPRTALFERHPNADQYFQVTEGELVLLIQREGVTRAYLLKAGQTMRIPAGAYHMALNNEASPVTKFNVYNENPGAKGTSVEAEIEFVRLPYALKAADFKAAARLATVSAPAKKLTLAQGVMYNGNSVYYDDLAIQVSNYFQDSDAPELSGEEVVRRLKALANRMNDVFSRGIEVELSRSGGPESNALLIQITNKDGRRQNLGVDRILPEQVAQAFNDMIGLGDKARPRMDRVEFVPDVRYDGNDVLVDGVVKFRVDANQPGDSDFTASLRLLDEELTGVSFVSDPSKTTIVVSGYGRMINVDTESLMPSKLAAAIHYVLTGDANVDRLLFHYYGARLALVDELKQAGVIGIIPGHLGVAEIVRLAELEIAKGLAVEIVLRAGKEEDVWTAVRQLRSAHSQVNLAVGTLLTAAQANAAVDAGANVLVTPGLMPEVMEVAQKRDVSVIPGIATAEEAADAIKQGATILKYFPLFVLGSAHGERVTNFIAEVTAPLPDAMRDMFNQFYGRATIRFAELDLDGAQQPVFDAANRPATYTEVYNYLKRMGSAGQIENVTFYLPKQWSFDGEDWAPAGWFKQILAQHPNTPIVTSAVAMQPEYIPSIRQLTNFAAAGIVVANEDRLNKIAAARLAGKPTFSLPVTGGTEVVFSRGPIEISQTPVNTSNDAFAGFLKASGWAVPADQQLVSAVALTVVNGQQNPRGYGVWVRYGTPGSVTGTVIVFNGDALPSNYSSSALEALKGSDARIFTNTADFTANATVSRPAAGLPEFGIRVKEKTQNILEAKALGKLTIGETYRYANGAEITLTQFVQGGNESPNVMADWRATAGASSVERKYSTAALEALLSDGKLTRVEAVKAAGSVQKSGATRVRTSHRGATGGSSRIRKASQPAPTGARLSGAPIASLMLKAPIADDRGAGRAEGVRGGRLPQVWLAFVARVVSALPQNALARPRELPVQLAASETAIVLSVRQDANTLYVVHGGVTERVDVSTLAVREAQIAQKASDLKRETAVENGLELLAEANRASAVWAVPADANAPWLFVVDTDAFEGGKPALGNFVLSIAATAGEKATILLVGSNSADALRLVRDLDVKNPARFIGAAAPDLKNLPTVVLTSVEHLDGMHGTYADARFAVLAPAMNEGRINMFSFPTVSRYAKTLAQSGREAARNFYNRINRYNLTPAEFDQVSAGNLEMNRRYSIRPVLDAFLEEVRRLYVAARTVLTSA